ncbi:MAG: hypothetical protein PHC97_04735 [Patescibacteria group bacterium]|nr:hypothetical protein [Patescibacteria group bacterium]
MAVKKLPAKIRGKIKGIKIYGNSTSAITVLEIEIKNGKKLTIREEERLVKIFQDASSAQKAYLMPYYGRERNCYYLNLEGLNLKMFTDFFDRPGV